MLRPVALLIAMNWLLVNDHCNPLVSFTMHGYTCIISTIKILQGNDFCGFCFILKNWYSQQAQWTVKNDILYCILSHIAHCIMLIICAGDIARYLRGKQRGFSQPKPAMKVWFIHWVLSYSHFLQPSEFNASIEWSSVYQTARPYDPYLIPLPIRMGRCGNKEIPPAALHNAELLKVSLIIEIHKDVIGKYLKI